jgi:hypothetical protein
MLALLILGILVSPGRPQDTQRTLSVTINSTESGTVRSPAIKCPPICSGAIGDGVEVTLIATPNRNYRFAEWGGACSGTTDWCTVRMTQDRLVEATFRVIPLGSRPILTVRVNGPIQPSIVTSSPTGISCPNVTVHVVMFL